MYHLPLRLILPIAEPSNEYIVTSNETSAVVVDNGTSNNFIDQTNTLVPVAISLSNTSVATPASSSGMTSQPSAKKKWNRSTIKPTPTEKLLQQQVATCVEQRDILEQIRDELIKRNQIAQERNEIEKQKLNFKKMKYEKNPLE